jgi:hypothetical protein
MENSSQQVQSKKKLKWIWWVVGIIILIVIIRISSNSEEEKSTSVQDNNPPIEQNQKNTENIIYELSGEAESISSNKIVVEGKTNLPNNSILDIVISRISIWEGENMERFFIVASDDAIVNNGNYRIELTIDDREFLEFEKVSDEIIKELNENVEVSVVFYPNKQPKNVVDMVGSNGQKLNSSPQKKVFGSATSNPANTLDIEFRTKLSFPFMNELPK